VSNYFVNASVILFQARERSEELPGSGSNSSSTLKEPRRSSSTLLEDKGFTT
jgi:hypothetical protein